MHPVTNLRSQLFFFQRVCQDIILLILFYKKPTRFIHHQSWHLNPNLHYPERGLQGSLSIYQTSIAKMFVYFSFKKYGIKDYANISIWILNLNIVVLIQIPIHRPITFILTCNISHLANTLQENDQISLKLWSQSISIFIWQSHHCPKRNFSFKDNKPKTDWNAYIISRLFLFPSGRQVLETAGHLSSN